MVQLTPVLPNFCIVMSEASNIPLPNWVGPVQLWAVRTTTTLLGTENPICGKLPARIFNYLRVYVPGIYTHVQGASLRQRLPPPATLADKGETNCERSQLRGPRF